MKKLISIFIFLLIGDGFASEKIQIYKPAREELWGIKKIAIASVDDEKTVFTLLDIKLRQTNFFLVSQPENIENKLHQAGLTIEDLADTQKSKQVSEILAVDALLFAKVTDCHVDPDITGEEQVKKQIWTGKYQRDKNDKIIEENIDGKLVKKKLFEEKIINQKYRIRKGICSITFNLIDGQSGKVAVSTIVSKKYDSGKIPEEEIKSSPSPDQVERKLSVEAIADFVKYISPKLESVKRNIEAGDGFIDEGKIYALEGLWTEALEAWLKGERMFPNNSGVYYNIGLAYEALGEYEQAEIYYKKAMLIKDKKQYKKALKNIRDARDRKQKKLEKGSK